MGRDPGLRQARTLRQLRDGQLLAVKERKQSESSRVAEETALAADALKVDENILLSRSRDKASSLALVSTAFKGKRRVESFDSKAC